MKTSFYKDMNWLSWPTYQIRAFYQANVWGYDEEYICEAIPWTLSTEFWWRICRVRYLTGLTTLVDKMYAINDLVWNERMGNFNDWTADFIFQATDEATVFWYNYWDALSSWTEILTFSFLDSFNSALSVDVVWTIDQDNLTIALSVPAATDVTALKATFTTTDWVTVKIGATAQTSSVTANNFTAPVSYIVSDEFDTKTYTVTVTILS